MGSRERQKEYQNATTVVADEMRKNYVGSHWVFWCDIRGPNDFACM